MEFYPKQNAPIIHDAYWNGQHSMLSQNELLAPKCEENSANLLMRKHIYAIRLYAGIGVLIAREIFGILLENVIASIKDSLKLHRVVRLRQRYIMTRANRLRLRYSLSVGMCFVIGFATVLSGPASSLAGRWENVSAFDMAAIDPASGDELQDSGGLAGMSDAADDSDDSDILQPIDGDLAFALEDNQSGDTLSLGNNISEALRSQISDSIRRASLAIKKPETRPLDHHLSIGTGDTIAGVLQTAGVNNTEAHHAIEALKEHYDPRDMKPGQKIIVSFAPGASEDTPPDFQNMTVQIDPVKEVRVSRDGETYKAELFEKELVEQVYAGGTEIKSSLYGSAARAGIPSHIIAEMIRIYSWNVDFQRDIRQGDKIEVLYNVHETEGGEFAKYGHVLYANLTVGGRDIPIYRFDMADGRTDYFQPDGHSVRKTLMKTPVDGARISSGFGMRKHPILGYNKMHKGMDFAAPTGTPIYAAGDGVVEMAARHGAYGNYVRIRHNNTLKTAYAHLHKYAKNLSKGARVKQGDVIGYVGTTGRSTGPHLHYEVLLNGKQVNPTRVDLPTGEQLVGKDMDKFKALMSRLNQQYVSLVGSMKFAMRGQEPDHNIR